MVPQELPPAPKGKHWHLCACGDARLCSQPDGCDDEWECPHCEMDIRDRDIQRLYEQEQTPKEGDK